MKTPNNPPVLAPISFWQWLDLYIRTLIHDHGIFRIFYNTRYKVADDCFRSSHPWPYQLRAAKKAGVKTVISLRACDPTLSANLLEWHTCQALNLPVVHFAFCSREAPLAADILTFAELIKNAPRPILFHCKSGADRAGFATALYLLIEKKMPITQALKQMAFWRHGHVAQAKTGILDHFFKAFQDHQRKFGTEFLDWVANHYDQKGVTANFHSSWWAGKLVDSFLKRE